jgi:hypothetical protein
MEEEGGGWGGWEIEEKEFPLMLMSRNGEAQCRDIELHRNY